ncbi:exonuclease 1 [Oryctolagus cuniculus]|uniref:exonuclease 1 n=1 Tax=Oryctolagus cuniculus TaxID=9986 RepID=UPI002230D85B|nr:exonuclease 1 [Oryctolagus cuniculus]
MNITVPEDYTEGFIRANNTFLYQLVFDPIRRKLIPLNAYEDDIDPETLSYAGLYVDDAIALQIALGNKDINTLEQIDDCNPELPWFFCSSLDSADCVSKEESNQGLNETAVTEKENTPSQSDCPNLEGKKLEACNSDDQIPEDVTVFIDEEPQTLKTSKFTRTISPSTLGTLRSCFSWSGSLKEFSRSLSPPTSTALQQFQRRSSSPTSVPEHGKACDASQLKTDASVDELHPFHEEGCSSQSQESVELSSPHSLNTSKLSQPSSKDSDSEESDCSIKSLDNQDNQNYKLHLSHFSAKSTLLKNKVPGLYKSSSADSLSTKIKPLVPARASGPSKKSASIQRRNHHNAENTPGLQIKINELWKNFGFKKDSEKLPSCKKPLSPKITSN